MPPPLAKKAVNCPRCGTSQPESPGAISTFCRACGQHFELTDPPAVPAAWRGWLDSLSERIAPLRQRALTAAEPWLLRYEPQIARLREFVERYRPPEFRRIRCHECGRVHEVPRLASSTGCPSCNAHINLQDELIDRRVTRTVVTRGKLVIKKFGYLNNRLTICGAADIGGGASGRLFCDGETRIRTTGRLNCEIGSRRISIEKGADVIVANPIRVHDMVVRGKLTARIYCNGTLRVLKRGFLKGEIHARSIVVDKGGLLHAELHIGRFDEPDPAILGTLKERACYMALEDATLDPEQATLPI